MPKVSVIIPVYNTEKYLRKCIDSICNQTLSDIEIICVNDCSTDNCFEILKKYLKKDKRIKLINLDINGGAAKARNFGIESAKGEFVGFVDSDDFLDPDFYEKLYNEAKKNNADASKGNYKSAKDGAVDYELNKKIEEDKNNFAYGYCSAIFKRSIITTNNILFPTNLSDMEDPVFTVKFTQCAKKICIVDTNINIVKHEDSQTSKIPTMERIQDKIKGLSLIIDILNSNKKNITKESYGYVLSFWFWETYNNSLKNENFVARNYLVTELMKLFDKIIIDNDFIEELKKKDELFPLILRSKDKNSLINFDRAKHFYVLRKGLNNSKNA